MITWADLTYLSDFQITLLVLNTFIAFIVVMPAVAWWSVAIRNLKERRKK